MNRWAEKCSAALLRSKAAEEARTALLSSKFQLSARDYEEDTKEYRSHIKEEKPNFQRDVVFSKLKRKEASNNYWRDGGEINRQILAEEEQTRIDDRAERGYLRWSL